MSAPGVIVAAVAVIPVLVGPERELGLSEIGAQIAAAAAWRPALRVADTEELFVRDAELTRRLEECGADAACLAAGLRRFDLAFALLLVVNTEVEPAVIALRAVDVARGEIAAEDIGSGEGALTSSVRVRAARIFDVLGFAEAGVLSIAVDPEGAELAIEPAPIARAGAGRWWVAPGGYHVTARAGDRTAVATVAVAEAEERALALVVPQETPLLESPLLWAGAGAGAIAVVVTIVMIASAGGGTDVCLGAPGGCR